ncbi:MAG: DUF2630 family protein [Gaiellaceae bacterium]
MDDTGIHSHIEELVAEEHRLLEEGGEHARLEQVTVELDRYWDLLRQRRARREAGQDPESTQIRPDDKVEPYQK